MLKKFLNTLRLIKPPVKHRGSLRKTKGQSLVEFAITLPVLILLFSGMVEFGFMLNTYLSLQDATRAAARYYSNSVPFQLNEDEDEIIDNLDFYENVAQFVIDTLAPPDNALATREIEIDDTRDNVLVSVISVDVDETATPPTITSITRFPFGYSYYKLYADTSPSSLYTDGGIEEYMTANGSTPVDSGLLIVEIFYSYEGVLHLPWTEPFFSEDNPAMLYTSTIMPLVAAKP